MHNPKAPEIHDGEIRFRVAEQSHSVKERNRERAVKEKRRQVARTFRFQFTPKSTGNDDNPKHQAHDEQQLPQSSQVDVFQSLSAVERPRLPLQNPLVAKGFAYQAAENYDRQCTKERKRKNLLPERLLACDDGREKNSCRQKRRDNEKQGKL